MSWILRGALALTFALAAFAGTGAIAHDVTKDGLKIVHPWSRATPGGVEVGVGYLKIENKGAEADRLTGGTTPIAKMLQVHQMTMTDGVMKMRHLKDGLEIPAGKTVELKPGGNHLMLMGLKQPIVKGEPFKAVLHFEKAGDVEVTFKVEAIGAPSSSDDAMEDHQHDHGDH
ncbi:copper chaperone PCu(A)C [Methyloligella sp. 2.7D]|uniref:copper chaperone PCu(A)C n=1 Tax=unclassified Methyloligella TaxID=2625955 RepID=UPI00157CCDA9|nr:copper chaperone PCu(A)C [Methyloligella sp. GL2]QKP78528.1 copper chaperone PCu(A)C [Methyloligella sp. GL2]